MGAPCDTPISNAAAPSGFAWGSKKSAPNRPDFLTPISDAENIVVMKLATTTIMVTTKETVIPTMDLSNHFMACNPFHSPHTQDAVKDDEHVKRGENSRTDHWIKVKDVQAERHNHDDYHREQDPHDDSEWV